MMLASRHFLRALERQSPLTTTTHFLISTSWHNSDSAQGASGYYLTRLKTFCADVAQRKNTLFRKGSHNISNI